MIDPAREPEIPTGPAARLLLTTGTASNGRECVALVPQYLGKDGAWRLRHSGLMLRPEHARQLAMQLAMQLGHDRDRWPMALLKELVDKTPWPGCAGRTLLLHKDRTDGRAGDDVHEVTHSSCLPDLDVLNLVGGDQIVGAVDGLLGTESMSIAEKLAVKPGTPDVAVAKIVDLACRFGDPHCEGSRHDLVLFSGSIPPPISHSTALESQRHSDGPLPYPLEVTQW